MDGSLYDEDYYTWAKRQAAALRALSARAPSNEVDWANVIEEMETLGRSEVRGVSSNLARLMDHVALLGLAPADHRDRRHWMVEVRGFRQAAAKDYRPSMRQGVVAALDADWRLARDRAAAKLDCDPARLPEKRPFTLAELLHAVPVEDLPARLRQGC
jgi:cytochrome P450